jgi:signal transduction histidine kinase
MSRPSLFQIINQIGILPSDDKLLVNRKRFVVYGAIALSMGAILWGVLCVVWSKYEQSTVPFSYLLISAVNIYYFKKRHNFRLASTVQTGFSLMLPFFFQWHLGGFHASGGVMVWALLSLVLSVSYNDIRNGWIWLILYVLLSVASGVFDGEFKALQSTTISEELSIWLFAMNVTVGSILIFFLMLFFVSENSRAYKAVQEAQEKLIQSEKMAALGQLSAGIAHEINTPLGAIKAISSDSQHSEKKLLQAMVGIPSILTQLQMESFLEFVGGHETQSKFLSTREERQKIVELSKEIEALGLSNGRNLAVKLVQVDIFGIPECLKGIPVEQFPILVDVLNNLFLKEKNCQTIQVSVEKASRIVKALKMYVHRPDVKAFQPYDLMESIETVLTIYQNQIKQGVTVNLDIPQLPKMTGQLEEINQIWTNLIVNACQAMQFKGTLDIVVRKANEKVTVAISDTGNGIPPEIGMRIFEPFFTTKRSGEGSGLGLDIVKKIVEKHQGRIWYESVLHQGTTFYVELPFDLNPTLNPN